jgi:hypothetical protein
LPLISRISQTCGAAAVLLEALYPIFELAKRQSTGIVADQGSTIV